jgi:hypothetical protein
MMLQGDPGRLRLSQPSKPDESEGYSLFPVVGPSDFALVARLTSSWAVNLKV